MLQGAWWRVMLVAGACWACGSASGGRDGGADPGPADVGGTDVASDAPDPTPSDAVVGDVPGTTDEGPDSTGEVAGDAGPDVPPYDDGTHPMEAAFATALDNVLKEYLAFSNDPGVSAAVRLADGSLWVGAQGLARTQDGGTPMTPETQFRVGSNTKPYVAALVLDLVREGRVGLDEPLTTYLPEYPAWSKVTVRQVLGMQAGIPDYMWVADFMIASVFSPETLTGPDVLLSYVKDKPLEYEPGADCRYCNTNYVIAGMIAQRVTGNPPEAELKKRFFDPLGLTRTFLDVEGKQEPLLAHGYLDLSIVGPSFGIGKDALGMIPGEWFLSGKLMDSTYTFPPMFSWTAGALVTNPGEALRFMRALIRGELIPGATLAEMQKTNSCSLLGSQVDYGLGLSHGTTAGYGETWGHGGLNFGYEANTVHAPAVDFTISHMHNYLPEQSWPFQALLVAQVKAGPKDAPAPCLVPEGFFGAADGDRVRVRFRGRINAADPPYDEGISWVRGSFQGEDTALYGYGTRARRKGDGAGATLELRSEGPALARTVDRRTVTVDLPVQLLAGKDGVLTGAGWDAGLDSLVTETPAADQPDGGKACVFAVPDKTRVPAVALCGGTGFQAATGDLLKIFVDVPVTADPAAIDAWLAAAGRARCL